MQIWHSQKEIVFHFIDREEQMTNVMKRLFFMYEKGIGRYSYLREIWKDFMYHYSSDHITSWLVRYLVTMHLMQKFAEHDIFIPQPSAWCPDVPLSFLKDLFKTHAYDLQYTIPKKMSVRTRYNDIVRETFVTNLRSPVNEDDDSFIPIAISLQQCLQISMEGTPMRRFCDMMKHKAQQKLLALHHALTKPTFPCLSVNEGYTINMIMQDYLSRYQDNVYV